MREVMRHSEWMSGYQCEIEDNPARRSVEIHSDGSLTAEAVSNTYRYYRTKMRTSVWEHLDSRIFHDKLYAAIQEKTSEVTG
jgi:hypothetical protein